MKKHIGKICPYCKVAFNESDEVVYCDVCDMPHHKLCWEANGGCTTFACTGKMKADEKEQAKVYAGVGKKQETVKTANTRIETLYESKEIIYQPGVPILLEQTVLMRDIAKDALFVRCSFRSITDKSISAIMVDVYCKDVWGNALEGLTDVQILDLRTKRESVFGQANPILLTDKNTRSVTVVIKKIMYADASLQECSNELYIFPSPVTLEEHYGNSELAEEYARETDAKAKYLLCKSGGMWRCACGAINFDSEEVCNKCGHDWASYIGVLNDDELESRMIARQEENARREEQERLEREERIRQAEEQTRLEREKREAEQLIIAKKKKKKKRITIAIIITCIVLALAAAAAAFVYFYWIPKNNYEQACALLEEGKYDEAYAAFVEMGDYEDSAAMSQECIYQKGMQYLEMSQWDAAKEEFNKIPDYKDSKDMVLEVDYQRAYSKYDSSYYYAAIEIFEDLGNYKDSKEMILECKYQYIKKEISSPDLYRFYDEDTRQYIYMTELYKIDYKDSAQIYNDLYEWRVELECFNTDEDNYYTIASSIPRRGNYLHYSFNVTGGLPGETINLTHSTQWPGYREEFSDWHWLDTYGRQWGEVGCEWPDGYSNSYSGTLIIRIYNLDTGELMATEYMPVN